jgi:CBS domain-containing protein
MIGSRSGCLPVVEDGKLLGIVTTTDLMHIVSGSPSASSKEVPAFAGSKE